MRVAWLLPVLHRAGCIVMEDPGWQGRGRDLTAVRGVVLHHTATPRTASDSAVVRILREGRDDLPGPLCQLGLDRRGRFHLIADGRGNHNGFGLWGNSSIGIEAFNDGVGEPWPVVQLDSWQRGTAAILAHLGYTTDRALGHRETDPRKPDPRGIDLYAFRSGIDRHLNPPPAEEDLSIVDAETKAYLDAQFAELGNTLAGYGTSPDGKREDGIAPNPEKRLSVIGQIARHLGIAR